MPVMINEIYSDGGFAGGSSAAASTYRDDYIVLYNPESTAIDISGWSIQYATATGSTWYVNELSGIITAGGFFLIKEAGDGNSGASLPSADMDGTINLGAFSGKVALVNDLVPLTGVKPVSFKILDLVGYGATATDFEGTGPAPVNTGSGNATTSIARNHLGVDTDQNASDFTIATPLPQDSHTTPQAPLLPPTANDFGNNGHGDILWVNDDGRASIWDNGMLAAAHIIAPAGTIADGWHFAATGDFDGGGTDILWINDNGKVSIWGAGQIADAHIVADLGATIQGFHVAGTGDFDGKGKSDILWINDNGMASVWGDGQLSGAHVIAPVGTIANGWHFAGTGDFDGNGKSDIAWVNDNGKVSIWDNGQIGGAHIVADLSGNINGWHLVGTGDFDGNGKSDFLWVNDNGLASIWDNGQLSGAHAIAPAGTIANGWHCAGTSDFNGDGKSDILWVNDNGMTSVWDSGALAGAHITAPAGTIADGWHFAA